MVSAGSILLQAVRYFQQYVVATGMAPGIVNELEIVQVKEKECAVFRRSLLRQQLR